jgi:uncharacterized protein YegL
MNKTIGREIMNSRMNIVFLVDCSPSMDDEKKIALLNRGIRELQNFFVKYSTSHSIDIYLGVYCLDWISEWMTSPPLMPISSYKFQDIVIRKSRREFKDQTICAGNISGELTEILRDLFWIPSREKPFIFLFSDGNFQNAQEPEYFIQEISDDIGDLGIKIPVAVGKYIFPEYPYTDKDGRVEDSLVVPEIDFNVRKLENFLARPNVDYNFPFRLVTISEIVDYCERYFVIPLPLRKKTRPNLYVVIIADCSSSMKGDKLGLLNKGIRDLLLFLDNFSYGYSLNLYVGIIRLSAQASWLTDPEIIPLSSLRFQDLEVIEGVAHPSASYALLTPFLEKFPERLPNDFDRFYSRNLPRDEYPVIFFLSDGNFDESSKFFQDIFDHKFSMRCVRIPVFISESISLPPDQKSNFRLLDEFRAYPFCFEYPIIHQINILELKKINDFFNIPFRRARFDDS